MEYSVTKIRNDGSVHYFGAKKAIKRLGKRSVEAAIHTKSEEVSLLTVGSEIQVWGDVGGSMLPYQALEWALTQTDAFGVYMAEKAGLNCLVLILKSSALVHAMTAYLTAQNARTATPEAGA